MALRDVLWSCPLCGVHASLRDGRRGEEVCSGCGARFRRAGGAFIEARAVNGATWVKPAEQWMAELPAGDEAPGDDGVIATADASVRVATGYVPVRNGRQFLNRIEQLSAPADGVLTLYADRLAFVGKGGLTLEWPLLDLGALGSASGTLQLRGRRSPTASIRLHTGSIRWWEERLRRLLRNLFRTAGRGEIVEFQPRIVVR